MNKWSDIQDLKKKKALLDIKYEACVFNGVDYDGYADTPHGTVYIKKPYIGDPPKTKQEKADKDKVIEALNNINQPERKEDDKERTNKRAD